jgi:hypothetical protein
MENDRIDPEDVDNVPSSPAADGSSDRTDDVEIPVPIAMSAAEIDERAQAVESQTGSPAHLSDDELQP